MTWRDVPPPKMRAPPLIPDDFFTVLGRVKPSVGPEDIKRCYEWSQEYGLEGA
jgi:vacuolar protein-sorting-associated protein 4